ncbi:MAG: hypothetical protein R3A10_03380 [Caldilineaceae bacterium]
MLALLAEQGDVLAAGPRLVWSGHGYPARQVSLRSGQRDGGHRGRDGRAHGHRPGGPGQRHGSWPTTARSTSTRARAIRWNGWTWSRTWPRSCRPMWTSTPR